MASMPVTDMPTKIETIRIQTTLSPHTKMLAAIISMLNTLGHYEVLPVLRTVCFHFGYTIQKVQP